ncbi:MAG: class I SAM-dependent methyltransferase [Acidimicrobiales bacterium]
MDAATIAVYERRAREWIERRGEATDDFGRRLREELGEGPVVDLGCGAGRYLRDLGPAVVGLDASAAMLELAGRNAVPLIRADLEALPLCDRAVAGLFARHSYLHVPKERLTAALRDARRALRPGGLFLLSLIEGSYEGHDLPGDDFEGRFFACWTEAEVEALLGQAGFSAVAVSRLARRNGGTDLEARARA